MAVAYIVPAITVTSRAGSELIAELRARGAVRYQSAIPVGPAQFGSNYILDQLCTIGVVREGAAAETYFLDEQTLASIQVQARYLRFVAWALAFLVLASLLGVALANWLF